MPLIAPCVTNDRGISVGQNDAQRNNSAPTVPANLGRPRIVRRRLGGSSAPLPVIGSVAGSAGGSGSRVAVVSVSVAAMGFDTTRVA